MCVWTAAIALAILFAAGMTPAAVCNFLILRARRASCGSSERRGGGAGRGACSSIRGRSGMRRERDGEPGSLNTALVAASDMKQSVETSSGDTVDVMRGPTWYKRARSCACVRVMDSCQTLQQKPKSLETAAPPAHTQRNAQSEWRTRPPPARARALTYSRCGTNTTDIANGVPRACMRHPPRKRKANTPRANARLLTSTHARKTPDAGYASSPETCTRDIMSHGRACTALRRRSSYKLGR